MQFNIRTGNYAQAGKAAADDLVRSFAAARRNSPDFGKMAQQAQVIRSKVKREGINASAQVTKAGIDAAGEVESYKITNQAKMKRDGAKRKAGALAVAGKMFGQAGNFMGDKRTKREVGGEDSWFQTEIDKAKQKATDLRTKAETPTSVSTPSSTGDETVSGNSGTGGGTTIPEYTPPEGGKTYSQSELETLAVQGGFSQEDAPLVARIAMGESSGNPNAFNGKGADQSYGIMQINMLGDMGPERRAQFGISFNEELYDPLKNMQAAYSIYQRQGWGAWGAYTNGSYQKF